MKTYHKQCDPAICSFCAEIFPNESCLKTHEKYKHGQNQTLCRICGAGFPTDMKLCTHMKTIHPNEQPSEECDKCDRKFFTKSLVNYHFKTVHLATVKCLEKNCERMFYRKPRMKKHYATVHEKSFQVLC